MPTVNMRDFPADLHKQAKIAAAEEETTLKGIIVKALTEYLEKRGGHGNRL